MVVFFQRHFIDLFSCIAASLFNKVTYFLTYIYLSVQDYPIGRLVHGPWAHPAVSRGPVTTNQHDIHLILKENYNRAF